MHHSYSPKGIARLFVRIGFGLSLALAGYAHYQDPGFAEGVGAGLGMLEPLGMIWGYVLPGLMILGGLLLAFGIYMQIGAYASAIALASIPAGLMLKSAISGIPLDVTMPPAQNALIWILVLMVAAKGSGSCSTACCGPNGACACCVPGKSAPMKNSSSASVAIKKAPVRKKK